MDRWLRSSHEGRVRSLFTVIFFTFSLLASGLAWGIPAYPGAVIESQPDGTQLELRIRGDEHFNWMEDANGYTVVREGGWYHYATLDGNGNLVSSGLVVGQADPAAAGLSPRTLPAPSVQSQSALAVPASQDVTVDVLPLGTVKNLVILVRFSDHTGRTQPSEADIDVLMNAVGGDPVLAPTGSVRDVYLENSYGQMTLDSTITNWTTVSNTEAYYADGDSGTSRLWEALREALDDADAYINFNDYDTDGDGYIDSITFLHSGYGAEWGGTDAYGAHFIDRIWSHRWAIQPSWQSNEGVRVFNYHISPALWGLSGSDIGRIGVIAHETGHFFGLPDLYDTGGEAGNGIGSWGMMANSWGFDGSQLCPPHFSPWSKVALGWYSPTVIADPGQYTLNEAEFNAEAYRIDAGYPANEYLMIENRQSTGFDCSIPQGGLLIWHIDDDADHQTQGYPGQAGWPGNGNHYRVAVLQADGLYELEQDINRGDAGDVHRAGGVDAIGPGPGGHPNTDAYQAGNIIQVGHAITNISASGPSMTFCLNGCSGLNAPSALSATAAGSATINLAWTDNSPDEDGFNIERSPDGASWAALASVAADVTAYADNGLDAGTTYYYRVQAYNIDTVSSWSNTANDTTDDVPPATPTGLTATANGENQIDLAWTDASNNEDGFRIERSFNGTDFAAIASVGAGVTSYSNTGLTASTLYYYRVYAFNSFDSPGYAEANATTDAPPPVVEYLAYADQFGSGQVSGTYQDTHTGNGVNQSITEKSSGGKKRDRTSYMGHFWRFNIGSGDEIRVYANAFQSASGDGDNFVFHWSDNDSNYDEPGHELFTVSSTSGSNTELGYIPNSVSGEVWIRVIDTDRSPGNSRSLDTLYVDHLYIEVENLGPPTAPDAPSGLNATSGYTDQIDLSWADNSPNEQGFRLERSLDGVSGWTEVASLPANTESHSDTGLNDNTTYYYRVKAWNGVGDSAYSNVASATTDEFVPITVPNAPSGLTATSNGANSILLAWTDNADNETGFWIQRSLDGVSFSTIASIGPENTVSYDDTSVSPATTYYYQVRAVNSLYQSDPSNVDSATTDAAPNITLSVNGYKVRGKKNFDLTWSGALSANVDVYRDGGLVATTANDGAYTDATNLKGGGSHTHQVCEQGTTTCSDPVVTSF
ncbi:MAG: M6 family metalloprotease domain-containing protein [Xanthomonadales bacterium]|nr:M6 family metalloprotease domain-containing protein [Xanthomonadales bacterium]